MKNKIKKFIENKYVNNIILIVIIYNAIILGMMTYPQIMSNYGAFLEISCGVCVVIFTIELIIKLYVYEKNFFKDGWNIFDFFLVAISWIPTYGAFSSFRVFRILRVLRTLRLITKVSRLRIIVQAIIESIPNVGWASILLLLVFYIFAIMGTTMFSDTHPEFFGTLGKSMFSLFQIMTLESWSMGIARPVILTHSYAWIYFISFILTSTFVVMNVIVGVIVNAIGEISEQNRLEQESKKLKDSSELYCELDKLKKQIKTVEIMLEHKSL